MYVTTTDPKGDNTLRRRPGVLFHGHVMSVERLLAFSAMSLFLIMIPGPSVLFVVGRALAHGRRAALTTVVGNTLGAYGLVIAVAFGIGSIVERSALVFTVLKIAGAAYLIYLGVKAFGERTSLPTALTAGSPARSTLRTLWDGLAVGVSNPKTIVFFAAVLPQFVERNHGHVAAQMLVLGMSFCLIAVVSDSVWGVAVSQARDWFGRSPKRLRMVGGVGGLTMIGLGVTVAVTGRKE
jgi:threonine/homoserine/homoserine lactone efflux protein